MYYLNKIVWFFLNPVMVALLTMALGWIAGRKNKWAGRILQAAAFVWLILFSLPVTAIVLGKALEEPYVETESVDSLPAADAIVLLGGGMLKTHSMQYPDMNDAADRVWHAARLWKAGKAPIVVASGIAEENGAVPLLLDFGVPREAILLDNNSRNTYENARFTERLLAEKGISHPKTLLVTSAWHMTRALGNFSRTDIECIPAATDFRVWPAVMAKRKAALFVPDAGAIALNASLLKEWLGRLARK